MSPVDATVSILGLIYSVKADFPQHTDSRLSRIEHVVSLPALILTIELVDQLEETKLSGPDKSTNCGK